MLLLCHGVICSLRKLRVNRSVSNTKKKTVKNGEVKNEHLHRKEQQGGTKEEHRDAEGQMLSEEDVVRTG